MTDARPFPTAEEIFDEALDRSPEERAAYLEAACRGDPALRAEVESLLASYAGASRFFARVPDLSAAAGAAARPDSLVGGAVGPYRLTGFIARGGMGAVYLAERADEVFRKRVAVKLIRPELASPEIVDRFRNERQVLAELEHPGIARILDGGTTADGVPYLVMEHVDGVPLDSFCDARRLSLDERLCLFLLVCDAVHYAHRNLVVHRDLKPSNILVTRDGEVKLLDFGVAKVLEPGSPIAGDSTLTPAFTPRYASPEQLRRARVTTSSDVYGLGVVLYELLSGRSPYRAAGRDLAELHRAILEQDPPRMSRRALEDAASADGAPPGRVAADRGTTPRKLARRLAGDLDTIVLRALSKEPERRYSGVDVLAADLRRHLGGLPVLARPDTAAYRIRKFAARHRGLATAIVGIILVLAMSLGFTASAYRRGREATRRAEWLAYASSLAAAQYSILQGRTGEARERLEQAPAALRGWEWQHLVARLDRSRRRWEAHRGGITRVAYSADGARILTCAIDSTVRLWDASSGRLLRTWGPLPHEVESADLAARGDAVAAGLADGSVLLLPPRGGPPTVLRRGGHWASVALSPDGGLLAAGALDGTVETWSTRDGRRLGRWKADSNLPAVLFTGEGSALVTGGSDGIVRVWDAGGRRLLRQFGAHGKRIYTLAGSPDGSRVAAGSMDHTASVWDPRSGALVSVLRAHSGTVAGVAFIPGTERLVTAGADGRLLVWDAAHGRLETELHGHAADVSAVAASPVGDAIVTGDWHGTVRSWSSHAEDVRTLSTRTSGQMAIHRILDARIDRPGRRVAGLTDAGGNLIFAWDLAVHAASIPVAESPGSFRIAWAGQEGALVFADSTGRPVIVNAGSRIATAPLLPRAAPVAELAVSPAGDRCASATDSTIRIGTLPGLDSALEIRCPGGVERLAWSGDGRLLAAATRAGTIRLWDGSSGAPAGAIGDLEPSTRDLAFHPRRSRLACASGTGRLLAWDFTARGPRRVALGAAARITSVAYSPDGARFATGGEDGLVRLFDDASGREVLALQGHASRISSVEFSADGALLVSGSRDGTIRLWDSFSPPAGPPGPR